MEKLESKIKIKFKNKDLLRQALVHRSYLNENPEFELPHNERLEFLGDAVLELVVTDYLFKNLDKKEGEMTALRAALVNTKMLAHVGRDIEIEDSIMLSQGEDKDKGRSRDSILANTIEAIIGALYMDQGYEASEKFISDNILSELPRVLKENLFIDAKSHFQELAQEKFSKTPHYSVLESSGPDHKKSFVVGVYIGEDLIAKGEGRSKQEAEQEAARSALDEKFSES